MKPETEQEPTVGRAGANRALQETPTPISKECPPLPPLGGAARARRRKGPPAHRLSVPSPGCHTLMRKRHFGVNMGSTWVFTTNASWSPWHGHRLWALSARVCRALVRTSAADLLSARFSARPQGMKKTHSSGPPRAPSELWWLLLQTNAPAAQGQL